MVDKVLVSKKAEIVGKKQLINFIPPIDQAIETKLHSIANKGYGVTQPTIISLEEIQSAINEWKSENQIYSSDINSSTCTELSMSFKKILQISNLDNLVKLQKLKLDNNMIMKMENLDRLVNIKWLDLSFNFITKIENINTLTELTDLSLFSNQISEVEGLDNCRRLNVLSLGKNSIKNPKEMVDYLRKFSYLQALNIYDNPFCKEEATMGLSLEQHLQQKTNYFPQCYDVIIASLQDLKYLDWKPIDEDIKILITDAYKNNSNQKERNDYQMQLMETKQKELLKEYEDLKKANCEEIIDFFRQIERRIIDESTLQNFESMKKIKRLDNILKLLEKFILDTLVGYKEGILLEQTEKEQIIKLKSKEIELGQEKFVEQSKSLVSLFKRDFKEKTLVKISGDVREKIEINIKDLVSKLLEIEVWEKQKMKEIIEDFRRGILTINEKMSDRTGKLKDELDNYKNPLRTSLSNLLKMIEEEISTYEEQNNANTVTNSTKLRDNKEMEEMIKIWDEIDLQSEMERITDSYEEKVSNLKEQLDNARNYATTIFFEQLNEKEFYRSKKRIEDINQISKMYNMKLVAAIEKTHQK